MTRPPRPDIIGDVSDPTPGDGGNQDEGGRVIRPRPWQRSIRGRYLGGVAAGAARWLELDPLFVRVGLVVVAVFWPITIVVYLALWLLLPSDASTRPLLFLAREPAALRELLAVLALAVAVVLLLHDLRPGGSRSLQLGIVLIGTGLTLLTRTSPSDATVMPLTNAATGRSFTRPRLPAVQLRRRQEPRPSPFLTPLAISLVLVLAGIGAALEWGGSRPVSPGTIVSLLMVLVGATLVVSAWWGRARTLILLVPPLALGWVAFSLSDVPRHPGFGERIYTVNSPTDLREYALGAGSLTVNATQLHLRAGQEVTIDAAATAGTIEVNVPFDAELRLDGHLGLGQVEVWDDRVGAYFRQYDTGPSGNQRVERHLRALQPHCSPASEPPPDANAQVFPTVPPPTTSAPLPGNAQSTTSTSSVPPPPVTTTTVVTYRTFEGEPCDPDERPVHPPVIIIRFEIGAGALEVHRVETLN